MTECIEYHYMSGLTGPAPPRLAGWTGPGSLGLGWMPNSTFFIFTKSEHLRSISNVYSLDEAIVLISLDLQLDWVNKLLFSR